MADKVTLKVNTVPSDARVRFYIEGAVVQSGETFSVSRGTAVRYNVQKEGYIPVENTIVVTENTLLNVYLKELQIIYHNVKVKATPNTATVRLIVPGQPEVTGTGSATARVVEGTTVSYIVQKTDYTDATGSIAAVDDVTYSVGLHQNTSTVNFNVTVNPSPDDAKVLLQDKGLNVIINGEPSLDYNLIASKFSRSNYLSCVINNDEISTVNSCEIVFRILTPNDPKFNGRILNVCGSGTGEVGGGPYIEYFYNGTSTAKKGMPRLCWYNPETGSSISCNAAENLVEKNIWYYCKWVYSREDKLITGYTSTDGASWVKGEERTLTNTELSKILFSVNTYFLGVRQSGDRPTDTIFNGSIDLFRSYIKINDDIKWKVAVSNTHLYNHSATASSVTGHYIVIGSSSWGYNDYKHDSFSVKSDMTIPVSLNIAPGAVLFESSTPGNYQIAVRESKYYDIVLVGAGGGGAGEWYSYTHTWTSVTRSGFLNLIRRYTFHSINYASAVAVGGGSGSNYRGTIYLAKGTYTLTIGEGGLNVFKSHSTDYVEGKEGGSTILSGYINGSSQQRYVAFGGKPGVCQLNDDCTIKTAYSQESNAVYQAYRRFKFLLSRYIYTWVDLSGGLTPTKGNKGKVVSTGKLENRIDAQATADGGLSTYLGYGVGGKGSSINVYKAGSGYAKLTAH